ncbi:MAG: hypothetical protein V1718_01790 [archaeon]
MINLDFVDKLKTKFQKKSLDQEIDAAFDDSGAYSKKVLDSNSKYSRGDEQLSSAYQLERQPEPPKPVVAPGLDNPVDVYDQRQSADPDDPLSLPAGIDRPPQQGGAPLQRMRERSTDYERREFFGASPPMASRSDLANADVGTILLELKDLRTQNEHIMDLLKNIQDRLRRY